MKHIKEYNTLQQDLDELEKIEELGDCLQEIFDKHGITREESYENFINRSLHGDDTMVWTIKHLGHKLSRQADQFIVIRCGSTLTSSSKYREVYNDILKIQDMIQKRIHNEILCSIVTFTGDIEHPPTEYERIRFIKVKLV